MRKAVVMSIVGLAAAAGVLVPAMAAVAAPPCATTCVTTFTPGAQTTWTVPINATDVTVVVAAGAGGTNTYSAAAGGAGGQVTVDLGTAFNGDTLHILVGDLGANVGLGAPGGGGSGSYVADTTGFIAVAGGGGGSGALAIPPTAVPGGVGGYASASGDGTDGATVNGYNDSGLGAVGATPGTPTTQAGLSAYGGTGGVASVAPDGTITPGVGGNAGVLANFPVAQGGGGYAGGGGGSAEVGGSNLNGAGAGGGGSGFLAAGLTASATTGNIGAGSITFTYTFAPTITAPATSVAAGSTSSTTVSGMPESTAFTVLLTGTTQVVGSGTTDASGDPITVPFTLPAGTSVGVHSLTLQVGSTAVATSPTFTVSALTLAATGVAIPSWAEPGAATAIVFGMLLLGLSARRRRARAEAI